VPFDKHPQALDFVATKRQQTPEFGSWARYEKGGSFANTMMGVFSTWQVSRKNKGSG
jgi:hypothetical protein